MCETATCVRKGSVVAYAAQKRYDPTNTTALRNAFVADMKRRFTRIKRMITEAIVDQDVFGLIPQNNIQTNATPLARSFAFQTSAQKVDSFMNWLRLQEEKELLSLGSMRQIGTSSQGAWTDMYVTDSYKRGVQRARYEMGKAGLAVPSLEDTGGISASMSTPFHMDRVGLMYTRVFEELKGITNAMDTQISRVLSQGMVDGDNPRTLAKKLNSVISGGGADLGITDTLGRYIPAERRAATLARTEVIRAHHSAMVQEYKNWAVEGVVVKAEWSTAGFDVCPICQGLEGKVYELKKIEGMIPRHPNCRCIALPTMPEEKAASTRARELTKKSVIRSQQWRKAADARSLKPEFRAEYLEYKKEYVNYFRKDFAQKDLKKWAKETEVDRLNSTMLSKLQEKVAKDFPVVKEALYDWAGSTTRPGALQLKITAQKVERKAGQLSFSSKWTKENIAQALAGHPGISSSEYLRFKAFNQAFMERAGIPRTFNLYRGIGGETGASIRSAILREGSMKRTRWDITENPLSGYSSKRWVADDFGKYRGGVTVSNTFNRAEIFVHNSLFTPLVGRLFYFKEFENLVISYRRTFRLKNITYKP